MAQPKIPTNLAQEALDAWHLVGNNGLKAARKLGMTRGMFEGRLRSAQQYGLVPGGTYQAPILQSPARINFELTDGIVIVGSDAHYWPGGATTGHRAFVEFIKELKPKAVILNGDMFDGARISRFPRIGWDKTPSVVEELHVCKERLTEIEDACSKSTIKIWGLGNHDGRYEVRLAHAAPGYEGIKNFHLKDHFPAWKPCWRADINADTDSHTIIKHTFKGGINAPKNNVLGAMTHVVTGHLHSLKWWPVSTARKHTLYGVDNGMLGEPDDQQFTDYSQDNPKDWRSGFVVLTYWKGILLQPETVKILDEGLVEFRGKVIEV